MVYNEKTLEALHPLTEDGKKHYQELLERKADEILFKHQHPLKWAVQKLKDKLSE